ncbi:hypothetical protein KS4_13170 [Poriferisphaera corsica]|uniref:PEP-CTERM protein-sorting domain-containing protein n=1 Tax=Poriferisphaera corsica TaxID=2528020 RepID=A0A517YSZ0_9BACT|nr:hypothetical protein [Poriferisphaera corsica]QDU33272.1 hypothetical protein KS4_13170 [Poriferisphaera corsica]
MKYSTLNSNLYRITILLAAFYILLIGKSHQVLQASAITLNAVADVDVRSGAAANDAYNRNVLFIKQQNTDPNIGISGKAYIRFELPDDFGYATSATFTMTRSLVGAWSWKYDVFGLNQDAETVPFIESENTPPGMTWNNALGNDIESSRGFDPTKTTFLGSWQVQNGGNGGYVGDQYSVAASSVKGLLNSDVNRSITFMVSRDGTSTSHDHWASKEDGVYSGPLLSIEYVANPSSARWNQWLANRQGALPISAWSYFDRYGGTVSEYETYRNAGLTMANVPRLLIGGSTHQVANAETANVGIILGQSESLHLNESKLINTVNFANNNSYNVIGYTLKDEPEPDQFSALRQAHNYIYENDPDALPICNILPNYAWSYGRPEKYGIDYEGYVQKYIDEVQPAVIGHTHYALLEDGTDRTDFYSNLELFRDKSLENGIGLFGFVLVTDHWAGPYRRASGSDIRWQAYSHMAYGAKGLYYYNYRIDDSRFGEGIVDHVNGQPTDLYNLVQNTNDKAFVLGDELLKLNSIGVYHTGKITDNTIPDDTTRYTTSVDSPFDRFWGQEFLHGVFEADDAASIDRYILLVNKRHGKDMNITSLARGTAYFTIDDMYDTVFILNPLTGNEEILAAHGVYNNKDLYQIILDGGDAALIRFTHLPEPTSFFMLGFAGLICVLKKRNVV